MAAPLLFWLVRGRFRRVDEDNLVSPVTPEEGLLARKRACPVAPWLVLLRPEVQEIVFWSGRKPVTPSYARSPMVLRTARANPSCSRNQSKLLYRAGDSPKYFEW